MDKELRLLVLGGLRVMRGGEPVTGFVSTKPQALLCYLAVTARPHFRDALAGLLWGEMRDADARMNLRHVLANLNKLVAPHLAITRETIAFNRAVPYFLDVERLEAALDRPPSTASMIDVARLREAILLYAGDFLQGFHVRDAPAFDEWVASYRERLRQLALQALRELAAYHAERAETAAAIDYL